jgi:hypothetical protein
MSALAGIEQWKFWSTVVRQFNIQKSEANSTCERGCLRVLTDGWF